jgi:hypothetical protein
MFVALLAVMLTLFSAFYKLLKDYMDAKIDPIPQAVLELRKYMVEHSERISTLEERTKKIS